MALRADAITFLPARIFGVEKQAVSLQLQIGAPYMPEDLSPLVVKYAPVGGAAGVSFSSLQTKVKGSFVRTWTFEVAFPAGGEFLTRIEWDGQCVKEGKDIVTVIESGASV